MGDKVKTKETTSSGEKKGWNDENNRWETDSEYYNRVGVEKSSADKASASKQEAEAVKGINEFKNTSFNYSDQNPYLGAIQRQLAQSESNQKEDVAKAMAQRGLNDSGQALRAGARVSQETQDKLTNLKGEDYLRQLGDWKTENQNLWQRAMAKYQVSSEVASRAKDEYYQALTLQSQQAMDDYLKQQEQEFNWGGVASGVASGALTGFMAGGPMGALIGGLAGGGIGALGGNVPVYDTRSKTYKE